MRGGEMTWTLVSASVARTVKIVARKEKAKEKE
jgi:hypothetical protein